LASIFLILKLLTNLVNNFPTTYHFPCIGVNEIEIGTLSIIPRVSGISLGMVKSSGIIGYDISIEI